MFRSPLHFLAAGGKTLVALLVLGAAAAPGAQDPPITAWQALLAERPEAADHSSISTLERRILQVLTPAQATAYAAGEDSEALVLANGETLASFLDRQRRLAASGLLYKPLVPCRVLDTRRFGPPLAVDEKLLLQLRGPATDYSGQGGENNGCGLPGLRGEVLRTSSARALMLSVEIHDPAGPGSVELWPASGARRPGIGLLPYGPDASPRQMLVVGMCDEESVRPCEHGDVVLALRGGEAHVVADVLGYFEPPWTALAQRPVEPEPDDQGPAAFKTTGPWHQNGTDVHYSDGNVGIGTDTPSRTLHLKGDAGFQGIEDDAAWIFETSRRTHQGYGGGAAHDTTIMWLRTPYEDAAGAKARSGMMFSSPEIWGQEISYFYSFGWRNMRLGTVNNGWRRSEIELYNDNTADGKIFFRTGTWQDPGNVPGTETNVRMMIDHNGNVGVGTTAPTEKLEVNGNFKLSGNMVSDGDICIGNCQ